MTKEASDPAQKHGKWGTFIAVAGAIAGLITALTGLLKACLSPEEVQRDAATSAIAGSSEAEVAATQPGLQPQAHRKCSSLNFKPFLASGLSPNSFTYIGKLIEAQIPIAPSDNRACKEAVEIAEEIQRLATDVDADVRAQVGGKLSAYGQGQHENAMKLQTRLKALTE